MKKSYGVLIAGLVAAIIISNACSFIRDGRNLEKLRHSVLRLHILANSDSEYDQNLKLMVRDALLGADFFGESESLEDAENTARENLTQIIETAEGVLSENGCDMPVSAEIEDIYFDERVYGDITMPAGTYRALRINIGSAQGHNWWCVMYPPLCIPAACEADDDKQCEENFFDEKELDIMYKPQKYQVRFAVWDMIKSIKDD
ncbi:MAG: stage II sporulation protein R [Ruminococcus sp.]|nr:stage II sporulation protein R [Ruminococcus sp.]